MFLPCFYYLFTSDLNLDLKAQAKTRGRDDPSQRAVESVSVLSTEHMELQGLQGADGWGVPMSPPVV